MRSRSTGWLGRIVTALERLPRAVQRLVSSLFAAVRGERPAPRKRPERLGRHPPMGRPQSPGRRQPAGKPPKNAAQPAKAAPPLPAAKPAKAAPPLPAAKPAPPAHATPGARPGPDAEYAAPLDDEQRPEPVQEPLQPLRGSPEGRPGPRTRPRYANVRVRDEGGRPPEDVDPGALMTVAVDIGPLRRDSDVRRPVPLPEELLPGEDLWLDVMLSSADVQIGLTPETVGERTAIEQRLLLPADGSAARTAEGGKVLRFFLRMPAGGPCRARLTYLYRNVAIQSQRMDFETILSSGLFGAGRFPITTDFTLSQQLGADVADLGRRDRMTVVMNETGAQHEFTVRAADAAGTLLTEPAAFAIRGEALGRLVERLREQLTIIAPATRERRRSQLVSDLRRLAPLGWQLYASLPRAVQDGARAARRAGGESVIEIVLPQGSTFTLPWSLVYDIYLDSATPPAQIPVCPGIEAWDERRPLVDGDLRECPYRDEADHTQNLLCPFGFWGFRHSFEVLSTTDSPKQTLTMRAPCRVVVAETEVNIDRRRLAQHVATLRGLFLAALPQTTLVEARTKTDVRREIEDDLPFLYFLCHGARDAEDDCTLLGVGRDDRISPADINGWIDVALMRDRKIWNDPQPLVFINACESIAITPDDIVDYLDAFVGKGSAAGVIGTEVRVAQEVAMQLAEHFFGEFLRPGVTLDAALQRVKIGFLAAGNLVGLVYTPYALADLAVAVS